MKKKLIATMMTVCLAAIALTGCGGKNSLKMATGGTTGTYYSYGGVVAQYLTENAEGIEVNVHSSGASKANIFEIEDGEADIAIVQNDVAYYAYNGTDLFAEDGAVTGFSVLGAAYAEVCQIVATPDIQSVTDLKGKVVSVGDAGSGCEFNAHQIFEAYGMTFDDITVQNLSFGDSAEALKDGKIDAFFCVAGAPTTAVVELATTNEINVLTIEPAAIDYLKQNYPFYSEYVIPAGTYNGVDTDTTAVAVKATFIVSNKLSEDVVYNITKSIYEGKDGIVHEKATELSASYAVDGIAIPFHAGAEKYYKEVGAL